MRKIKLASLFIVIVLFASCMTNRQYISDYSSRMNIVKTMFHEIYDLYRQGDVIINSVYLDLDTNKYHIEYEYRTNTTYIR